MSDALELISRYFVAMFCTWVATRFGLSHFGDADMVQAVTTVVTCLAVALSVIGRALYKSTVPYMIHRLKSRHAPALLAAASQVKADTPQPEGRA